jgi:hypothetical protein
MRVLRVFPRRTTGTPVDDMVRIGYPGLFDEEVDEVHISVTFSWDITEAELLYKAWQGYGDVKIGGPAVGDPGGEFDPGMYLKKGFVITSRGCPNNCWFCDVPTREGAVRELQIKNGSHILDSNILACSDDHIRRVFEMLSSHAGRELVGGLESERLTVSHVRMIKNLNPIQAFFAYDEPCDLKPLIEAGKMFKAESWPTPGSWFKLRCYVLCGFKGDSFEAAERRMMEAYKAGFMPFAMVYVDENGNRPTGKWGKLQKQWTRPAGTKARIKELLSELG